eukprot:m.35718 g.35718  ORF g.35718 m.35718 type:complete len:159 (-) comp5352_c0_seq2:278-754(-)
MEDIGNLGQRQLSSLPLQVCLYFNCFYWPLWLIGCIVTTSSNSIFGGDVIHVLLYIVIAVIEPLRLYVGYSSNLREKVSALFGFLLLSVLFEFPIVVALAFRSGAHAMEWALNIVQLTFLFAEGVFGYSATSLLTAELTSRYSHTIPPSAPKSREPVS